MVVFFSEFTSKMQAYVPAHQQRHSTMRMMQHSPSSSGSLPPGEHDKTDGSLSDTAVGSITELKHVGRREHSGANKMSQFMGLSKKSNSTSQLSATGLSKFMNLET